MLRTLTLFVVALAALVRAPQDPPLGRRLAEGEARITLLAPDAKRERLVVARETGLECWTVGGKREWSEASDGRDAHRSLALSVGGKYAYTCIGIPAVSRSELATGANALGGIASFGEMKGPRIVVADPGDRWAWAASDTELVVRTVPGSGQFTRRSVKNGGVTALALDPSGETLAVGGADGSIRFVDAGSVEVDEKKVIKDEGEPRSLAFAGKLIVAGTDSGVVRSWTLSTAKPKHALEGHRAAVRALAADDKGKLLASGDDEGVVKVWDLDKGVELASFATDPTGAVTSLAFVEKGKTVAAAHGATFVSLWPIPKR